MSSDSAVGQIAQESRAAIFMPERMYRQMYGDIDAVPRGHTLPFVTGKPGVLIPQEHGDHEFPLAEHVDHESSIASSSCEEGGEEAQPAFDTPEEPMPPTASSVSSRERIRFTDDPAQPGQHVIAQAEVAQCEDTMKCTASKLLNTHTKCWCRRPSRWRLSVRMLLICLARNFRSVNPNPLEATLHSSCSFRM